MILKVTCDRCGKRFKAEIDYDPDRETKEVTLCTNCAMRDLLRRKDDT